MNVVKLVSITADPEDRIVEAGRVCHDSGGDEKLMESFIKRLIRMGHESVLEHASASFLIEGSRAMTHQLVRHRLASYSQRSQRYVDEAGFNFIVPSTIDGNPDALSLFLQTMTMINYAYRKLINMKIPKQDARFVLPNACKTKIITTANFRQWRHMIKLRASVHAQWEIRQIFVKIFKILSSKAPNVFYDFKVKEIDGTTVVEQIGTGK